MPKRSDYLMDRREFVGGVAGLIGAIVSIVLGLPLIAYVISPALKKGGPQEWITLGPVSAVDPGQPTAFSFSTVKQVGWKHTRITHMVYAITDEGGDIAVLSDVCTHLSCKVRWHPEQSAFLCPCHSGVFDRQGNVLQGPPPRPLDRFEARVENDQLMISVEN